jgi:hypothetical protein
MEQRAFINEHAIMAVYSIKERLLRQKPMLIRQMTLEEAFKRVVCLSDAEIRKVMFLAHHQIVRLQPKYDGHHDNDDDTVVPSSPGSSSKV